MIALLHSQITGRRRLSQSLILTNGIDTINRKIHNNTIDTPLHPLIILVVVLPHAFQAIKINTNISHSNGSSATTTLHNNPCFILNIRNMIHTDHKRLLDWSDELHNRDREQPPDQGIHSRFAGSPSGRQQQNQHAPSPLTPSSSGDNNAGSKGGTYWSTHTEEESLGDKNYRPSSHFDKTDAKNYNSHTSDYDRMPSEASNNNNNNNNNKANWRSKSLSKEELQSRFGTDMPKTVDLKSAIETCDLLCQFALHYGGREPSRATPAESVRGQFGENGAGGIPTIDPNDRAVLQNIRNLAGTMLVGVQNNLSGGDGSPTEAPSNNSNETLNSNQLPESKSPSGDKDRDEGRGPTEAPQFGPGPPSNEMVHELAKAATSIFQLAIRIKAWVNMTADERELDEEINIIRGKRCLFMDDMSPFPMPTAMTTTMTLDTVRGTGRSSGGGRSSYSNYNQGQPPGGGGGGANSGEYARQHPHQDYFPYYQHGTKRHNNYRNDMDDPYSYTHSHPHGPSSSNHGHPGGGIQSYADGYGDGMMTPKSGSEKGSENTPHQKYRKRAKRTHPLGRCLSCDTTDTPEWRRGPDGARTLCNACGLHYAKLVKRQKQLQQQQLQEQEHQQLQPTSTSSSSAANMPGHHDLPSNIGTVTTLMIRNDMNNRVTPMRLQPPTPIRPMDYTATEEPHSVLRSGSLDSEQEMTTEAAIGSGIDEDTIMTR
ncbi:hypothetical protein BGZ83_004897 [Gryganskiella cystojenkinii]|nr:hypothetical protein BGZ83_004897 [Gryganskiella cystojenkinii]